MEGEAMVPLVADDNVIRRLVARLKQREQDQVSLALRLADIRQQEHNATCAAQSGADRLALVRSLLAGAITSWATQEPMPDPICRSLYLELGELSVCACCNGAGCFACKCDGVVLSVTAPHPDDHR